MTPRHDLPAPYYDHNGITIYHGDALDILPALEGIGAVVTDPPYSSGGAFRGDRTQSTVSKYVNSDTAKYRPEFAGDTRDQRGFAAWCTMWLNAARQASEPGAVLLSFIDWRQLPTLTDAVQGGGWIWRGIGTWWKPGIRMQRARLSGSAEYVVYGTSGGVIDHDGAPQNVFKCAPVPEKTHIAEKPLPVFRDWLFKAIPPRVLVCDPFMGSGVALHAAQDLGYSAIGIDSDERSCETAAARLSQQVLAL
jgi:site-specific DNA-methyltransferase (adenine-specific)